MGLGEPVPLGLSERGREGGGGPDRAGFKEGTGAAGEEAPASVLTSPSRPTTLPGLSAHGWNGECRAGRREKHEERGREEGEVARQDQRRGTDLTSWILSHLQLKGALWPLVFKRF